MFRRRCLALLFLAAAACGREEKPAADGVAQWTVDSLPLLTLGRDTTEDSSVSFARITGATRLPDGQLLVADVGDVPLRLFDADGALLRTVARKGSGPGEIEYLASLFRCGDAIYTYDIEGYRISEFGLDGSYRRLFRFAVPTGQQVPYVSACNAAGQFAHLGWGKPPRVAGYHRDTVLVWATATPDGAPMVADTVAASERWGQADEGKVYGSMPLPLGRQPSIAYGPESFYVATGDAFEVLVFDTLGAARGTHRLADTAASVSPADVRDFIEAQIAEEGERRRAAVEREYADVEFPERHGALNALRVDADGFLWLRSHASPSAATVAWRVLDPAGRETATVLLPRRLEVLEIGRDYVLGRQVDAEEGVPVLQLWRLNRR